MEEERKPITGADLLNDAADAIRSEEADQLKAEIQEALRERKHAVSILAKIDKRIEELKAKIIE